MTLHHRNHRLPLIGAIGVAALALSACASGSAPATAPETAAASVEVSSTRLVASYDGGVLILDGSSLETVAQIALDGFVRLNPAGDERHVMISTDSGFQVLDTGVSIERHGDHAHYYAIEPELAQFTFDGDHPGHVTRHAGLTALFSDGTGDVEIFDPAELVDGAPRTELHTTPDAHHGVALTLEGGGLLTTIGTSESRNSAVVLDENREEIARTESCPGVHGEAVAAEEAIVLGCENGAVIYSNGAFTKVESPDAYGRIGNQAGSPESSVVLGDYKVDADAELERPSRITLIDTETATLRVVELNTSYSFRSLARGPHGEALILGTDGAIHVLDPASGAETALIAVVEPWNEPIEWQQPRPTIMVDGHTAYVTDPAGSAIHAVDLPSGEVLTSADLPEVPNELSGVRG